ncbi:ester cyclase [Streptomyces sp. NPDC002520]
MVRLRVDPRTGLRESPAENGRYRGRRRCLAQDVRSHPDIQMSVEDMLVDRDRVAVRSVLRGLSNSVPDGAEPASTMMEIFRVQHGLIAELWGLSSLGRPAGQASHRVAGNLQDPSSRRGQGR